MRNSNNLVSAAGLAVLLAWAVRALPSGAAPSSAIGLPRMAQETSSCVPEYRQRASPEVVLLGETVAVTLTARAVCPDDEVPMHVVLVADASGTMIGSPNQVLRSAGIGFIEDLDLDRHPRTQVGVVEFDNRARTLCRLTNNAVQAVRCVDRVGAEGGSAIDTGILEAIEVLENGRQILGAATVREVIVVLSDGRIGLGCAPARQAANRAKAQGVVLIAACIPGLCDEPCMSQLASSSQHYFVANGSGYLRHVLRTVCEPLRTAVTRFEVDVVLHPSMAFVADSARPPRTNPGAPSNHLTWLEEVAATAGVTFSFRVRPMQVGTWPTNLQAGGRLTDWSGGTGEWMFDSPAVTVLRPEALPTATVPEPPPTSTVTPESTTLPPSTNRRILLPIVRTR